MGFANPESSTGLKIANLHPSKYSTIVRVNVEEGFLRNIAYAYWSTKRDIKHALLDGNAKGVFTLLQQETKIGATLKALKDLYADVEGEVDQTLLNQAENLEAEEKHRSGYIE